LLFPSANPLVKIAARTARSAGGAAAAGRTVDDRLSVL
jgi:hypothetical protein